MIKMKPMIKSFFLNKKGSEQQGFTPWHLLMAGVVFLIMGFLLFIIMKQYTDAFLVYDKEIPKNIYAYRAINTCLAYQDPFTGRFYPGIIDVRKYNQRTLDNCYMNTTYVSFNLQLRSLAEEKDYPRILVGFGAVRTATSYPVLIRISEGNLVKGELLFGTTDEAEVKQETSK
jgi:hypothetical protein